MTSAQLSRDWRDDEGRALDDRRTITVLALVAMSSMGVVALYQLGIVKRLPDPPLAVFDSARIVRSADAYSLFATPDAVLALASYATTAALAAVGQPDRARVRPWLSLALAGKVAFDAYQAAVHSVNQWRRHRALCSWCLVTATATVAMVPRVFPEARAAFCTIHTNEGAS